MAPTPHGAAHVERHFLSLKTIDLDRRPSAATPRTGSALKSRLVLRRRPAGWAVDYARGLGFEPAAEFEQAAGHLGEWSGPSDIVFGYHDEPFFREGPFDNSARVMRTLEQSVRRDNFTFFVTA